MKKLTYLLAFFALSFGLSISAQVTDLDGLSDAKSGGAQFTSSLILGHANTATQQGSLSGANQNTFVGYGSGQDITQGTNNSALGFQSLYNLRNGEYNVAIGKDTGKLIVGGGYNVFLGNAAGDNTAGGADFNVIIGAGADVTSGDDAQQRIAIGRSVINTTDNTTVIGKSTQTDTYFGGMGTGEWNSNIYANALYLENSESITNSTDGTVVVSGNLTVSSDMRLKDNIQPLGDTMVNILKLDAKSYTREGREEIGLIAQDVQSVYPELVVEDGNGMLAVNYQALSAILINGIKDQEARIQKLELLVKLLLEDK